MGDAAAGIWSDDLLDRQRDAEFIKRFLINRCAEHVIAGKKRSYVLNLDGEWGQGKTFFLERLHEQLLSEGYLSVYVNSWKDDYADDPMIAVMAAIDSSLKSRLAQRALLRKAWDVTKKQGAKIAVTAAAYGAKRFASKLLGEGVEVVTNIAKDELQSSSETVEANANRASKKIEAVLEKLVDRRAEKALKDFNDNKLSVENFRSNLEKFIDNLAEEEGVSPPLFIFIDELDRCRPPYAISMLERIKHFFDVKNVVFVIATDSSQLRHSIRAVYGEGFDSGKYLMRFFDRTYKFSEVSKERFVEYLFSTSKLREGVAVSILVPASVLFLKYSEAFSLNLRDIEQCYDHLRNVCTTWSYARPAQLIYVIPLVMLFQQGKTDLFEALRHGKLQGHLKEILANGPNLDSRRVTQFGSNVSISTTGLDDVLSYFLRLSMMKFRHIIDLDAKENWQWNIKNEFQEEFRIEHQSLNANVDLTSTALETYVSILSAGKFKFDRGQEESDE